MVVTPSLNVTVPVADNGETVARSVIVASTAEGLDDDVRMTDVGYASMFQFVLLPLLTVLVGLIGVIFRLFESFTSMY